ncbi:hypothetical protein QVD17_31337 [Tagetes erecta]|uniref:Uncharacterized protein n=1 Tax=Tagetes erecta TaxID=13708 RepID=A0AAD8K381_TARER|nr:hypothetical protein QVD17_31337 [Tagetes erecta]
MDGQLKADDDLSNFNATTTYVDQPMGLSDCGDGNHIPQSSGNDEGALNDDSDLVLKYINQMLMEEDIHENNCLLQQSAAALQAAEKSLYNVLMVNDQDGHDQDQDPAAGKSLYNVVMVDDQDRDPGVKSIASFGVNNSMNSTNLAFDTPNTMISFDSQSRFRPSYSVFSTTNKVVGGFVNSPVSVLSFPDMFSDRRFTLQFQKGIDEASWFFPNTYSKDLVEDGRYSKQYAAYSETVVISKMFDDVLLCDGPKTHPFQCDFICKETAKKGQPGKVMGFNGVKARGKKQKEVVDLTALLSLCAQSVSINDQRGVTDLLKRIREYASPTGNGTQRLAHYFSAGLQARMAGSGTGIYKALLSIPTSAVDVLKAYRLFLGCFPFTKIFHFVSNKTIMCVAQNKTKLHIIDFGILYGFQWPCLIQRLSTRPGGPPELRITGIDFPCPGFRPAQRVEETGRRLQNYAETFGVRFKFKAIAQKWETIRLEDLELDDDETLVVNCGYRFRSLLDETVIVDSPRNKVLDLIKKMNPAIFIHGVVNGSYGVPFFLTRFKEALFFFSSLFDMLDATVDRLSEERMLVEKTMWGREAMNVIACEEGERIERPETYKQWQVRNQRVGLRQVAFDQKILKMAKDRGTSDYHKDFIIGEDGHWMLQGWKGRVLYAVSLWKPRVTDQVLFLD